MTTTEGSCTTSSGAIPSLLAMAEYFLTHNPQQVQEAIKCLLAVLSLSPPPRVEVRAKLQLGLVLYHHSNNLLEARQFLEQAMLSSKSVTGVEESRFEAASVLARIHVEQGSTHHAKKVLKSVMDVSHRYPYWHCRLLLQKADIHVCERDRDSLFSTLSQTADFAHHNHASYTRLLCLLCKGAHLLIHKLYQDAAGVLSQCCQLMDDYTGPQATQLRALYLIIQVAHLLVAGQMKTAKPHLKQLQQCVKNLCSEPDLPAPQGGHGLGPESFEWLSKEQTYILVYLVSLMHAVLAGRTDKATSYANKALGLLQQQQQQEHQHKDTNHSVLGVFQAHVLELTIVCRLMQGNCSQAAESLQEAVEVCHCHSQLVYSHRAVLHTLLGLYAFATDNLERAVAQFQTALQHTNSSELRAFVTLNLAMAYLKQGPQRDSELSALIETLQSESSAPSSQSLKGAFSFVKGLYTYKQFRVHEAKKHLRETLMVSNSNDLIKLTVCALVVLGQIFLSLGNTKETQDMANPAFQLAGKIPDKRLQAWSAALLADLHHSTGDQPQEQAALQALSQTMQDISTDGRKAASSSQHSLIQWTVGDWPIPKKNKGQVDKDVESTFSLAPSEEGPDVVAEPVKERRKYKPLSIDDEDGNQPLVVKIQGASLSKTLRSGKKRNTHLEVSQHGEVASWPHSDHQNPKHPRIVTPLQPGMESTLDFDHSAMSISEYNSFMQSRCARIRTSFSRTPMLVDQGDPKKDEFSQQPCSTDIPFIPSPTQAQPSQQSSAIPSSHGGMWQSQSNPGGGWTEVVPPQPIRRRENVPDNFQEHEGANAQRGHLGFPPQTSEIGLSRHQVSSILPSAESGTISRPELDQQQQDHWQLHHQHLEQPKMQQQLLEQQRIKQQQEEKQQQQQLEQQRQRQKLEKQQQKQKLEQQQYHQRELEQQQHHRKELEQQQRHQRELELQQCRQRELEEQQHHQRELEQQQRHQKELEQQQHHQKELEQQQRHQRELEQQQHHQRELEQQQRHQREQEQQQRRQRELEQLRHQEEQDRCSLYSPLMLRSPPLGVRLADSQVMPGALLHHTSPVFSSLSRHSQLQQPPSVHSPASSPRIFSPPHNRAAPSPSTPPRVFSPPQQHLDRHSPALHPARHSPHAPHSVGMPDRKIATHGHRQQVQTSPLSHSGSSHSPSHSGHSSPAHIAANPVGVPSSDMRQGIAMHQFSQQPLIAELQQQEPGSQKLPTMPQLTPFSQYAQQSSRISQQQQHHMMTVQPHVAHAHQQQMLSLLQQQHQATTAVTTSASASSSSTPTTYHHQQSRMISMLQQQQQQSPLQHKFVQQPSQQSPSLQQQQHMLSFIQQQQAKQSPQQQSVSLLQHHQPQQRQHPAQGIYWQPPSQSTLQQKQFGYSALSPEAVLQQQHHQYMQQHGSPLLGHMSTSQLQSVAGHSPSGVIMPTSVVHISQQASPVAGVFSVSGASPGPSSHHLPGHNGLFHHLSQQQQQQQQPGGSHVPGHVSSLIQPSLVHHAHPLMAARNAQALQQQFFQNKPT